MSETASASSTRNTFGLLCNIHHILGLLCLREELLQELRHEQGRFFPRPQKLIHVLDLRRPLILVLAHPARATAPEAIPEIPFLHLITTEVPFPIWRESEVVAMSVVCQDRSIIVEIAPHPGSMVGVSQAVERNVGVDAWIGEPMDGADFLVVVEYLAIEQVGVGIEGRPEFETSMGDVREDGKQKQEGSEELHREGVRRRNCCVWSFERLVKFQFDLQDLKYLDHKISLILRITAWMEAT
jgi:hypothetical protein